MPQHGPISEEVVERLRNQGASDEILEWTDRRVTRFSQVDLDRAVTRAFVFGVGLAVAVWVVITWAIR